MESPAWAAVILSAASLVIAGVNTAKPTKLIVMPDSPAAISMPLGSTPKQYQILGTRYAVMFDRILTPSFTADVDDLRTWNMDIRQVLSAMLAEEERKFIAAVDAARVGVGTTVPLSGTVQYKQMNSPITRDSLRIVSKSCRRRRPTVLSAKTTERLSCGNLRGSCVLI